MIEGPGELGICLGPDWVEVSMHNPKITRRFWQVVDTLATVRFQFRYVYFTEKLR